MKRFNTEFTRFVVVGGINTLNYYAVFLFFHQLLSLHYMASHLIGFMVSLVISFFLNSYFTYRVKPTWAKFLQFPITQLVNVGVSSAFVFAFVEWLNFNSSIAPLFAVIFTIPVTFIVTGKILKTNGEPL
ncbi:GtrA family protein [Jeotgalibacillus proteolyticus]|uniref:GtrA family protein n=1 Tax=Jeotgalibacillus proteolyticus TaxID=2082395 RepID=A0A2S5GD45_9BACL|nr:GtrA family protein [Jeotgalibacillus proteolyticus]PPA70962.1 GtrA family protein [Jeotgalibacillus proteolyticus]